MTQTGELLGYARVSTGDQNPQSQEEALRKAGVKQRNIYTDHGASGASKSRPQWDKLLQDIEQGDTLVVAKLDRAGRSLKHLIELVEYLEQKGAELKTLDGQIDTTGKQGKLTFHIFATMAEFERDLIRERTNAGLATARAQGRTGGAPRTISNNKRKRAKALAQDGYTVSAIAKQLNISRQSVYRIIEE